MARSRGLVALIASTFVVACTGAIETRPPSGASPGSSLPSSPAIARPSSPSASQSSAPAPVLVDRPWANATLTDVQTGEALRIGDLVASGKVVFIETMAIWCTNCHAQQVEATAAFAGGDMANVVWVAVDVEASETAGALARYREQNGFPFTYVIADAGFARALVAEFGEIVLSPPSVNIIVIGTGGRVTQLRGHKSAEQLRRLAAEHGA